MSLDPRSHALSLAAVFLALGTGILIGAVLLGQDTLSEGQRELVRSLERDFSEIRGLTVAQSRQIERLSGALRAQEGFGQAVMEMVVDGALQGKKILLVEFGSEAPEGALRALDLAGATVTGTVSMTGTGDGSELGLLGKALADPISPWSMNHLAEVAAAGHVFMRGSFLPPDAVLLWVSGPPDEALHSLVGSLNEAGLRPVVLTPYESGFELQKLQGVSTVDCGDMAIGQVAMVFLLEGAEGHYGLGQNTLGPLPERVSWP